MTHVALLIPFYNERNRFNLKQLENLMLNAPKNLYLYLIDDGSTDQFSHELEVFIEKNQFQNIEVVRNAENMGKAEALRFGLNSIQLSKFDYIGFTDADFSADSYEIVRLAKIAFKSSGNAILGCRIRNGKNEITTTKFRYFQGQLFSKFSCLQLSHHLSDSQCGLKFFPVTSKLEDALREPFMNTWLFDLELLLRLSLDSNFTAEEIVLEKWVHVLDSKVKIVDSIAIVLTVLKLRMKYGNLRNLEIISKD
jgi:glycosyltransferase involved in cell wall biosynthesis